MGNKGKYKFIESAILHWAAHKICRTQEISIPSAQS